MDQRPKPRIWNGDDDYESDADADEKPHSRFMDADVKPVVKNEIM